MIYLASPYTDVNPDVMLDRYNRAVEAVTVIATREAVVVYSPVVHWHQVAVIGKLPRDFVFWRRQNFGMLRFASELCVLELPGWEVSQGVTEEIKFAESLFIPVTYL